MLQMLEMLVPIMQMQRTQEGFFLIVDFDFEFDFEFWIYFYFLAGFEV